jgi:two-component system chemotaxis response regulator CheB
MGALGVPASAGSIKVMLVEDSAVVRGMVRKWLEAVPGVEVTQTAGNGAIAIEVLGKAVADIILLDIEMPVMDGLTALPEILRRAPRAKVIIASTLSRRNAEITLRAMSLGASDYILKPSFSRDGADARAQFQDELVRKVEALARPKLGAVPGGDRWLPMPAPGTSFSFRRPSLVAPRILALGSSTGGPAALGQVIGDMGSELQRVPTVIAQHMPATFTTLLGETLAKLAGIGGGEAHEGDVVVPGRLYLAPGGRHMRLRKDGAVTVVVLDDGPPINGCRPAVDPLFDSVAAIYGPATLAAVLTGMGSDGARGARRIADAGGTVFAQDEQSSVVWGMPGATAAAGAAVALIDIARMGPRLVQALKEGKRA